MVSLVEKFYINIPDLAGLMILPEILIVIQERLFADPRLATDYKIWTIVVLSHKKVYTNVEQLRIVDNESYIGGINQMLELFPNLEKLEVQSICLMHDNFFAGFELMFQQSNSHSKLVDVRQTFQTQMQIPLTTKSFQLLKQKDSILILKLMIFLLMKIAH
eukprot:403344168